MVSCLNKYKSNSKGYLIYIQNFEYLYTPKSEQLKGKRTGHIIFWLCGPAICGEALKGIPVFQGPFCKSHNWEVRQTRQDLEKVGTTHSTTQFTCWSEELDK